MEPEASWLAEYRRVDGFQGVHFSEVKDLHYIDNEQIFRMISHSLNIDQSKRSLIVGLLPN